jgi:hypothetical protein
MMDTVETKARNSINVRKNQERVIVVSHVFFKNKQDLVKLKLWYYDDNGTLKPTKDSPILLQTSSSDLLIDAIKEVRKAEPLLES